MKRHELLSPAGNMECLRQAVFNGCDAVYISGRNFGARKFATNFSNDEIVDAINFCHLYGVRVYVTMNTLIRNDEVEGFIEQARFLHKNGVDALIVQDFGMICLLREMFPNLEIHASTQFNNSSLRTIKALHSLGVEKVVFSREMSIDEIDSIDVPIKKEAFIHGALCVSYSGCCLMSSMLGGRSGNRGECAGSCRLPYSLMHEGKIISHDKYLLSMKELNTSSYVDRLMKSSIDSFKIEGRMKSDLYVAFITNFYRKLMDGEKIDFDDYTNKLKTIFNREFTAGHLFSNNGKSLINDKSPNHIGLKIGRAYLEKDKIKIILDEGEVLNQHDAIRFLNSNTGMIVNYVYDEKDRLCNGSNNVCYVDNKVGLECSDVVCKTQDVSLEKEFLRNDLLKRIKVRFSFTAKVGKELLVTMSDGENTVSCVGDIVQKSINSPVQKADIYKAFSRLNETPYELDNINFDIDEEIFIPIKSLNEIRRRLVELINEERCKIKVPIVERSVSFDHFDEVNHFDTTCSVYNEEQLNEVLSFKRIYVRNKELYNKYKDRDNVYYYEDRCCDDTFMACKRLVSDVYNYDCLSYGSYSLNVTNIYTAYYLIKLGIKNIALSVELNEKEILDFIKLFNNKFGYFEFEVLCYGYVENMIIKGNILDILENDYNYLLIDFKKRKFNVYFDGVNTHVLNYIKRDFFIDGVSLRFDFYNESGLEVKNIINKSIKNV